jgi:predicted HNH restriction endonuclease
MMPNEEKIKNALLVELYNCQDHAAQPNYIYEQLLDYYNFRELLMDIDFEPYKNSKSRWANRIQVVRENLRKEGLILGKGQNKHNEWKLSPKGILIGRELSERAYGDLDTTVKNTTHDILLNFSHEDEELAFPEGKLKYELHTRKERNIELVKRKKQLASQINPLLPCEICKTSFKEKYGEIGADYIEAHHILPISELTEETPTKLSDLILICSNCHKMIHRKRPWLTDEQLKELLAENLIEKPVY